MSSKTKQRYTTFRLMGLTAGRALIAVRLIRHIKDAALCQGDYLTVSEWMQRAEVLPALVQLAKQG